MNVLDAIGNTALVPLKSGVLVKLEMQNPTGSMKDRMAQAMIARPEADGRLERGDTVVEYTGGTTGASLALVCTVKGYRLRIVTSDAFSQEKRDQMAAFGAELTIIPSDRGNTTKELILEMIATARKLSAEPNTYWTNQLENRDSIAGYYPLGEEIWRQTNGEVDAFVQSVGSSASLQGVATVLKRYKPSVRIIAVEPAESPVLSGGSPGPHQIEGIGIGYRPPMWDPSIIDEVIPIATNDAKERARRLAREEGIFAGTSSGGNVLAAERLGGTVVTLMVDSGLKYVKDVYRRG